MSKHSKKIRRQEEWAGGLFPTIDVDEMDNDDGTKSLWLWWSYRLAPFEIRVEFCLTEEGSNWLYVDGDDSLLDDEESQTAAEVQYGAMTRLRLLKGHADRILDQTTRAAGLTAVRDAATQAGLFGRRESRRCVTPQWTTT